MDVWIEVYFVIEERTSDGEEEFVDEAVSGERGGTVFRGMARDFFEDGSENFGG